MSDSSDSTRWAIAIVIAVIGTSVLGVLGMGVFMADVMMATTEEGAARVPYMLALHGISFLLLIAASWLLPLALPWRVKRKPLLISGALSLVLGVLAFAGGMALMFG